MKTVGIVLLILLLAAAAGLAAYGYRRPRRSGTTAA